MAHDSPPSRTRADRHIQSLLLRGSADRSGASGDSPQPGAFRRVARGKTIWEERYRSIVDLESHLYRSGTRTIKVFLHLSQEEGVGSGPAYCLSKISARFLMQRFIFTF